MQQTIRDEGVSRQNLYRYFKSQRDKYEVKAYCSLKKLVCAVAKDALLALSACLSATALDMTLTAFRVEVPYSHYALIGVVVFCWRKQFFLNALVVEKFCESLNLFLQSRKEAKKFKVSIPKNTFHTHRYEESFDLSRSERQFIEVVDCDVLGADADSRCKLIEFLKRHEKFDTIDFGLLILFYISACNGGGAVDPCGLDLPDSQEGEDIKTWCALDNAERYAAYKDVLRRADESNFLSLKNAVREWALALEVVMGVPEEIDLQEILNLC